MRAPVGWWETEHGVDATHDDPDDSLTVFHVFFPDDVGWEAGRFVAEYTSGDFRESYAEDAGEVHGVLPGLALEFALKVAPRWSEAFMPGRNLLRSDP